MRDAEFSTDHQFIRSKVKLNIRPLVRRRRPAPKLNCDVLPDLTTEFQLRQNIAAHLNRNPLNITSLDMLWILFINIGTQSGRRSQVLKQRSTRQVWRQHQCNQVAFRTEEKRTWCLPSMSSITNLSIKTPNTQPLVTEDSMWDWELLVDSESCKNSRKCWFKHLPQILWCHQEHVWSSKKKPCAH